VEGGSRGRIRGSRGRGRGGSRGLTDADVTWVEDSGSQASPARRPISGEPPRSSLPLSPPFPSLSRLARLRESDGFAGGMRARLPLSRVLAPLFPACGQRAALSPGGRVFPCVRRPPQRIRRLGDVFCPKATPYASKLRRARRPA
jgi:hypothetical protein